MYTKKSLTNLILLSLEKAVDGYVRLEDFAYHSGKYAYYGGGKPLKKSDLALAFKRLRERGLIDLISDKKLEYRLTDTGKQKAILHMLKQDNKKWDKKWRVVIFDIPEKRRKARDLLRYNLKNWGFIPWQQSVWATKKSCTVPLRKYIEEIGIKEWVIILETKDIFR